MTKEEKIRLFIEKGITYNPETGIFYGSKGNEYKATARGYIYLGIKSNKKHYNLSGHILAWYLHTGQVVDYIDHINQDKSDNRVCNLRAVTNSQNMMNNKHVKGYYFHKMTGKYMSRIKLNGVTKYLGVYNTEQEARQAYLDAKKIYHII